ncbi:MAG TPA: hypothetical protein DCS93_08605 [Microscillaceae bacterium]|nr:hypothetical protein [Microscillaceae bacterium]
MNKIDARNILRGDFYKERSAYIAAGEPGIFHCHHYNCYLQAVLLDTKDYLPNIEQVLVDSAQEVAYSQFQAFFQNTPDLDIQGRKHTVTDYFRFAGFGQIDLDRVDNKGGTVTTNSEHYGVSWKLKFGKSNQPISFFTTGFLAGATEAIYGLALGTLNAVQESCLAMGDKYSQFTLSISNSDRELTASPQEGVFQTGNLPQPTNTSIDYEAIREALIHMPIEGAANGLIDSFGVLLTRHYANYYCNISYRFLNLFMKSMGTEGLNIATSLLIEGGRVCAFNTFGGVMQSNEWNALIKPMIKTREDWIHGIIVVVNALGWGIWQVEDLDPGKRILVKIQSGYESNAYLKKFGPSSLPISFLAAGGVAGLMNLVYALNLPERAPITLDEAVYKKISLGNDYFVPTQIKCRAMGAEFDLIEAALVRNG